MKLYLISIILLSSLNAWATHPWNVETYLIKLNVNPLDFSTLQVDDIESIEAQVTLKFIHSRLNEQKTEVIQNITIPLNATNNVFFGKDKFSYHFSAYESVFQRSVNVKYTIKLSHNSNWFFSEVIPLQRTCTNYEDLLREFEETLFGNTEIILAQTSYAD